ncbi:MAG: chlorophyll a/b-binding protein [Synechococcales cyanobacterium]
MVKYRTVVVEDGGRLNNYAIEPEMYVDTEDRTGWTEFAEKLNGRLAMIGFISLIATEALLGQSLVGWLGSL